MDVRKYQQMILICIDVLIKDSERLRLNSHIFFQYCPVKLWGFACHPVDRASRPGGVGHVPVDMCFYSQVNLGDILTGRARAPVPDGFKIYVILIFFRTNVHASARYSDEQNRIRSEVFSLSLLVSAGNIRHALL